MSDNLRAALEVALSVALHEQQDPGCTGEPDYLATTEQAHDLVRRVWVMPLVQSALASPSPEPLDGEPRTKAGRALLDRWYPGGGDGLDEAERLEDEAAILAIEAEAAAPSPEPLDEAGLWEKFTTGEKLAYGIGYRRGRLDAASPEPLAERLHRAMHGDERRSIAPMGCGLSCEYLAARLSEDS